MKSMNKIKLKLLKLRGDPQRIARGFAIGTFVGMIPLPGFQVLISVTIAALFKWNKLAAGMAVFNTNILTGPFIFFFNYYLGAKILGYDMSKTLTSFELSFGSFYHLGSDVFQSLLLGGIISGLVSSVLIYHVLIRFLSKSNLKKTTL